jgi:hypothetical protein
VREAARDDAATNGFSISDCRTGPQSPAMARTLVNPLNLSNAISDVDDGLTANSPVGDTENVAVLTTPERT